MLSLVLAVDRHPDLEVLLCLMLALACSVLNFLDFGSGGGELLV